MGFLIKENSSCLFLRVPDYKNYNSIEEHIKKINEYGYVWMVKLGKYPRRDYLKLFMQDGGILILKTSPKYNNKYYVFKVGSLIPENELIIPNYYKYLFKDEGYDISMLKSTHLWLRLDWYKEISEDILNNYVTLSTKNKFSNAILHSRAPLIYGISLKQFEL